MMMAEASIKSTLGWVALALMVFAPSNRPTVADTRESDEAAAIEWLRTTLHPFTNESPAFDELLPVVSLLDGAQIVGIGEATHGSHEDQAFKVALIKALIEHSQVYFLVLEANRQVGADLDNYVISGVGDLATLLRSSSVFRNLRTEEFAALILWIRAYNIQTDRPVHVIGVDCQDAGADSAVALRFLGTHDRSVAAKLKQEFGPLAGPNPPRFSVWANVANKSDYVAALSASNKLADLFAAHRQAWFSEPGYVEAAYAAKVAHQALDAFELDGGRGDPNKDEKEYYGRRDRYMAANMLERLNGRRGIFSAHDLHIIGDVPATDGWSPGYTWVGREMRHVLGDQYQTVTFAWSQGTFRAQTQNGTNAEEIAHRKPLVPQTFANDRPGDLGELLLRAGPERFWVDLRTLPLDLWAQHFSSTAYPRGWAGWRVDPKEWNTGEGNTASLRPGTDILVWFKHITPSHMLPGDDF